MSSFTRRSSISCAILLLAGATVAQGAVSVTVPGYSNPYLAGMPNGSTSINFFPPDDVAPDQSPVLVPVSLVGGTPVIFSNVTGSVSYQADVLVDPPDGDGSFVQHLDTAPGSAPNPENGIADMCAPLNSLVGVFLDDSQPDLTAAPDLLDFSGPGGLDFLVLSPLLKQPFFIGDGLTSTNIPQLFMVPAGATRLYLGTMDGFGWRGNTGAFDVTVNAVPEPTVALALLAVPFLGRRRK